MNKARVQVYKNLNKDCLSVRSKRTMRVSFHVDNVLLGDCKFIVQRSGRDRVRKEQSKNVHAWIEGDLMIVNGGNYMEGKRVTYDPYKYDSFVVAGTEEPVYDASLVYVDHSGDIRVAH